MLLSIVILIVSLAAILAAAELFTNGVEWIGSHLGLGEGMVGSVLAAVGTAMPETMIPLVAILFLGGSIGHQVGTGAILGAPFMLSTLAMFVTGFAIWIFSRQRRRSIELRINADVVARDIRYFLMTYALAIATAFAPWRGVKVAAGFALLGLYAFYVWQHFQAGAAREGDPPEHLHLTRAIQHLHTDVRGRSVEDIWHRLYRAEQEPRFRWTIVQTIASLVLMVGGAAFFVRSVETIAAGVGIPAVVLSLIIAPIATELPEKFNSVIWVRSEKDTLALGNVTGAMVFQSCIPTAIGMFFTSWAIADTGAAPFVSAAVALASALVLWAVMRRGVALTGYWLLIGGGFYVAYLAYALTLAAPS